MKLTFGSTTPTESAELLTQLLDSSDASESRAKTLAQYDAQLAELDRLIAEAEFALAAERSANK